MSTVYVTDKRTMPPQACWWHLSEPIFALLITGIYALLVCYRIYHHAMWLDEWQAWLIAAGSTGPLDLLGRLRYEGHPAFWHLCLWLISRVWSDPLGMKIFHATIATITAFVVSRYAPFTRIQRVMLVFGYFLFVEYAVISRCYAMGVALMITLVAIHAVRGRYRWAEITILSVLPQTSFCGAIVCVAFLVAEQIAGVGVFPPRTWRKALLWSPVYVSLVVAGLQMLPQHDGMPSGTLPPDGQIAYVVSSLAEVGEAFWPIHALSDPTWQKGVLHCWPWVQALMAMTVVGFCLFRLRYVPVARSFFLVVFCATTATVILTYGAWRHEGHIYLAALCSFWIAENADPEPGAKHGFAMPQTFLNAILLLGFVGGIQFAMGEFDTPFSGARQAARIISEVAPNLPVVSDREGACVALGGYLDKPFFSLNRNQMVRYVVWDSSRWRRDTIRDREILLKDYRRRNPGPFVVVTAHSDIDYDLSGGYRKVADVRDSFVSMERYTIYLALE